jgi:hypothetical protein
MNDPLARVKRLENINRERDIVISEYLTSRLNTQKRSIIPDLLFWSIMAAMAAWGLYMAFHLIK